MMPAKPKFDEIGMLVFDIDGTLTDAKTWWAGPAQGWVQRYSVRDGEAFLRMKSIGFPTIPLSANNTQSAKVRMERLGLVTRWLGISDKEPAIREIASETGLPLSRICYIGDGLGDAAIFSMVGIGCAVADAHPETKEKADYILTAKGGEHAVEELELLLAGALMRAGNSP